MKPRVSLLLCVAMFSGVAICALADAGATGTVSGAIRVERARVKTSGPKSFKDVVVYLEPVAARPSTPPAEHAVMDQRGLIFLPHVLAVQTGTTVDFLNSDNDRHNVYFLYDDTGDTLDIGTWGPGQTVSHTFERAGLVITLCQLHLEMAAYILVLDSPFRTVVSVDDGTQTAAYELTGVPAGEYDLKAWHKKLKMRGGTLRVSVTAGETAQADIVITKAQYAESGK